VTRQYAEEMHKQKLLAEKRHVQQLYGCQILPLRLDDGRIGIASG